MKALRFAIIAAALVAAAAGCKKFDTKNDVIPVSGVKLDYSEETLVIYGSLQLHATVEPANATYKGVSWSSSNEEVATVSGSGLVSALKKGDATITATAGIHEAKCIIHVENEIIHVTGIAIKPDNIVLMPEASQQVSIQLTPANATNHNVTWYSGNESIVTVNDGKVTAVGFGNTTIKAVSEDGGHEATATVKVIQPFTSVTFTNPTPDNWAYENGKFIFMVGQQINLQAVGEPSDYDDEIEFVAIKGMDHYTLNEGGYLKFNSTAADCCIDARSKADHSVLAKLNFDIYAAPESITLATARQSDYEVQVWTSSPNYKRNTEYIGRGETQKFKVVVGPSSAPQNVRISQGPSWSVCSASLEDGILSVSVPYNAAASTTSNTVSFTIKLSAANGHTTTFTFKVSRYDPYKVKTGDLITKDGKICDGGYRGNGLFEESVYKNASLNSIIAWLGDKHTTEEPGWIVNKPSEGVKDAKGNVLHGIAIPTNTDRLYRTTEEGGEYYYEDSDNDNFILDSGNKPSSWLREEGREELMLSTSNKHSAIFNTAVHVYTNNGRGSSYEIRPANFFVDKYTTSPGAPGSGTVDGGKYLFYGSFISADARSSNTTFNAYSQNEFNIRGTYMTTWLWPTIADFYSIFTGGDNPSGLQAFTAGQIFTSDENRVNIFKHSAEMAGYKGANTPTYDCYWWVPNESGRESSGSRVLRLTQAHISETNLIINTNVPHKDSNWKAYVLPIRYF